MSNWIPKEKLTAYQRWEVAAFDEQQEAGAAPPPDRPPAEQPPAEQPPASVATGLSVTGALHVAFVTSTSMIGHTVITGGVVSSYLYIVFLHPASLLSHQLMYVHVTNHFLQPSPTKYSSIFRFLPNTAHPMFL